MTTLAQATYELAKIVGNLVGSTTTAAGSATTIVDSTRTEPADYWNNGTLWCTVGTTFLSRKITDWALSGTTFTIPTTTNALGSGKAYYVINGDWPRNKLVEWINQALAAMGDFYSFDETTATVADQRRYTLPSGVGHVQQVEMSTNTTEPLDYWAMHYWREHSGQLYFDAGKQPAEDDYLLRLWYKAPHAELTADSDTLNSDAHIERVKWEAAVFAWQWRIGLQKQWNVEPSPTQLNSLKEAQSMALLTAAKHPINRAMIPVHVRPAI
jgi:hypothetical protein